MGENNCKWNNWQKISLQTIQAVYATQYQKNNSIKKWAEDLNRHSSKEDIQNGQQTHEKMLNTLIIRETQIKTTMRYHLTPIRMVIITKSTNSKTRERI